MDQRAKEANLPELREHYRILAKKLVDELTLTLTLNEHQKLLQEPLSPLTKEVSAAHKQIHSILTDAGKENASESYKIKAALLKEALEQKAASFVNLSPELHYKIGGYLTHNEQSALIKSDRYHYNMFQPNRLLHKLFTHVIRGEQKATEAILRIDPRLLLAKGRVIDYSGRTIVGTVYQLALGAEDVKYNDDEECMVEMIEKYFNELQNLPDGENGEDIRIKQIAEQFPAGWQEAEATKVQRDKTALNTVITAISNSQDGDDCKEALQAFRDYLDKENKDKVFTTGKHFNHQLLVEAFEFYVANYDRFGGDEGNKNNLSWRNVIGYIERYVPACTGQGLAQGLYYIAGGREHLNRSLKFRHEGATFFPLGPGGSGLGYDFAATMAGRARAAPPRLSLLGGFGVSILMSNKDNKLGKRYTQSATAKPARFKPTIV